MATWNPADKGANITLSNGNRTAEMTAAGWEGVRATISKASGKWYWEITPDVGTGNLLIIGAATAGETLTYPGDSAAGYGYEGSTGNKFNNGSSGYGDPFAPPNIIGIAEDLDANKIWWSKAGVWQAGGDPAAGTNPAFTGVSGTFFPMIGMNANTTKMTANFGDSAFSYTVPTGFLGIDAPHAVDVSDTVTVSELVDILHDGARHINVSESVDVGDVLADIYADARHINLSDSVGVIESVTAPFISIDITATDNVAVVESKKMLLISFADIDERIRVKESVANDVFLVSEISVNSAIKATEVVDSNIHFPISVSETVAVEEDYDLYKTPRGGGVMALSGVRPEIAFSGVAPAISFSGVAPKITFSIN